jgi:hypothetical protein
VVVFRSSPQGLIGLFTGCDPGWMHPDLITRGASVSEVFFVDLPDPGARGEVLWIALSAAGCDPNGLDLAGLAAAADGRSGAEIEWAVRTAAWHAGRAARPIAAQDVHDALAQLGPPPGADPAYRQLRARLLTVGTPA